jgi:DNA-binding transcriptional MerR regulator
MSPNNPDNSIDLAELTAQADVSARTVRYYIQQGLLPAPETRGPGAHYGPEHVDRLNLIRHLQREHLPLAEIRRRIEKLSSREVRHVLEQAPQRPRSTATDYIRGVFAESAARYSSSNDSAPRPASEPEPLATPSQSRRASHQTARSQWDRIALAPDVELHVRRPLSREQNRQVERLLEAARDIYEEKTP